MANTRRKVAEYLIQSKAIKLEPATPFIWASGIISPIYCDNRVTLSYPEIRKFIRDEFVTLINREFLAPDCIAGVATGAIAQGALVAEKLNLPFVYVRAVRKEHGRKNLIEGKIERGQKVVVVEDLISTGGSSLKAVEALLEEGCDVLGMVAIFTYGFREAEENFNLKKVRLFTLSDYDTLVLVAAESGYIKPGQEVLLKKWRENPKGWEKTDAE